MTYLSLNLVHITSQIFLEQDADGFSDRFTSIKSKKPTSQKNQVFIEAEEQEEVAERDRKQREVMPNI